MENRIDRIMRMELYYDTIRQALQSNTAWLSDAPMQAMLTELNAYYTGGQWLADYEADERGELPHDLKRGVLSQDGVFDLLGEIRERRNRPLLSNEELLDLIDKTMISIWENEVKADYNSEWIMMEDPVKCSLYFHLRNRLGKIFEENNIRIYTEYNIKKFLGENKRPDMVIARINPEMDYDFLGEAVTDILAIIEIKLQAGFRSASNIYNDYEKMKEYAQKLPKTAKLYMAAIWEWEDEATSWERKNAAWAKGVLTELNASYIKKSNYEIQFYTYQH